MHAEAKLPRRAPRRVSKGADATEYDNMKQFYRVPYFNVLGPVLGKVIGSISERFFHF